LVQGSDPESIKRARKLRSQQTPLEAILWKRLRAGQLGGYKFRRQHPIGGYIVDFCCEEAKLVVEVDGDSHALQEEYDENRTMFLKNTGYRVVRITNRDVSKNIDSVLELILQECKKVNR
jgi:very-short-patch-repair endonuclease